MKTVGVRELKDRLSDYLREVRRGESLLVTNGGEVIAEISPPRQPSMDPSAPAGLRELARRGLATLGSPSKAPAYPALPRRRRGKLSAAQLLEQERGKR